MGIIGGEGADYINLTSGQIDTMKYNSLADCGDTITGLEGGSDLFQFSSSDFSNAGGFHNYAGSYSGNASAGTSLAYFVYDTDNNLWYDSNGDTAGGETMVAEFVGDAPIGTNISIVQK